MFNVRLLQSQPQTLSLCILQTKMARAISFTGITIDLEKLKRPSFEKNLTFQIKESCPRLLFYVKLMLYDCVI